MLKKNSVQALRNMFQRFEAMRKSHPHRIAVPNPKLMRTPDDIADRLAKQAAKRQRRAIAAGH